MIYAETGRFPLAIDINVQIIKYWLKFLRMESNSYVKLVYVCVVFVVNRYFKYLSLLIELCAITLELHC